MARACKNFRRGAVNRDLDELRVERESSGIKIHQLCAKQALQCATSVGEDNGWPVCVIAGHFSRSLGRNSRLLVGSKIYWVVT